MSFVSPIYAASKISEVDIDCDKDWLIKGITSLKELAAGMKKGDLIYFDGTKLAIVSPRSVGTQLMTHGDGFAPTFEYPP